MPDVSQIIDAMQDLDLFTGNGLIGEAQLYEPASRAIFIGLGGTGGNALRRLKRIIHQRYKNISDNFSFIGIDSDISEPSWNDSEKKDYLSLTKDEKIPITHEDGAAFFAPAAKNLMPEYIRAWLNPAVSHDDAMHGAGGLRAAGRTLLFNSAGKIKAKFSQEFTRIRKGDDKSHVEVFILAGIGGGTGSGTLLDVGYIFRGVAKELVGAAYMGAHSIHAFIIMPDINSSQQLPANTKKYLAPNAFAALKEIDYWMNISSRGDAYSQQYAAGFTVSVDCAPFDYVWPITAINADNLAIADTLRQALTIVAETICAWTAYKTDDKTGASFVLSFANNRKLMTQTALNDLRTSRSNCAWPVSYNYTACGSAILKLPIAAINTYLACILFSKFRELYDRAFTEQIAADLPRYAERDDIQLTPAILQNTLDASIQASCGRKPAAAREDWNTLFIGSSFERRFTLHMQNIAESIGEIEAKIANDAIGRLELDFKSLFLNPEKGPYYLEAFIQNGDQGLIAQFENYKRTIIRELGDLKKTSVFLQDKMDNTYREGKRAWLPFKGGAARSYGEAMDNFYSNSIKQLECESRNRIYDLIIRKLETRVHASYRATFDVLKAFNKIFENNMKSYQGDVSVEKHPDATIYSWDVLTLPEIVSFVNSSLNKHNIGDDEKTKLIKDFLGDLYEIVENDIKSQQIQDLRNTTVRNVDANKFLAKFVTEHFDYLTNRTLVDYMTELAARQSMTLNDYLVKQFEILDKSSSPLYNKPIFPGSTMYYGTLPLGDPAIHKAWTDYSKGKNNREAYPSISRDTLVFMTIACGIPLYSASQLASAEQEYISALSSPTISASLHLVSATEISKRKGIPDDLWDWRYLPSIIPSDERPLGKLLTNDRAEEARKRVIVDRLFEKKILRRNDDQTCIYIRINTSFEKIDESLFSGELSLSTDQEELDKYRKKLNLLKSCIDGSEPIPLDIRDEFGIHFEMVSNAFRAAIYPEWDYPRKEVLVLFGRSFNIQLDTGHTEKIYDAASKKISLIDEILVKYNSSEQVSEQIVRAFKVGAFDISGFQFRIKDVFGDSEVLARGGGVDKYPTYKLYESLIAKSDCEKILEKSDAQYIKAIDEGDFSQEAKTTYAAFKAQILKEKKMAYSDNKVKDTQRLVLDKMSAFIEEIE
ncbi:MAG: tubulin-like doman-containing protein [Clostridiales bacterium]|jgi:hypothetical protein|nr:tubulin-like doman-containing protein [Clostridiales bacterium]